jgi:dihydroflavonol-4-reductase
MTQAMQTGDLCLVTGVSGYLASWVAHDLLEDGLRVRGTVRSMQSYRKDPDHARPVSRCPT